MISSIQFSGIKQIFCNQMKWVVITKYRHEQQVPEGENWFNFISEIIRPGAYDVDQLFWFKVDNFHHRSITVYPNRETFEKMKEDLLIYREEMKNAGIELVAMEEGPFLGGV